MCRSGESTQPPARRRGLIGEAGSVGGAQQMGYLFEELLMPMHGAGTGNRQGE
jgi:hypothetical protein